MTVFDVNHSYGPLMIDIEGPQLTASERERLLHPLVGGVILFARNYQSPEQLLELTSAIHDLRSPCLLITIDHEGGRVQRCKEGFTALPPMRCLGELWEREPEQALHAAHDIGFVLAAELRACGVDFSFTPVLDLDWGQSAVIGDRSFHHDHEVVIQLAGQLVKGLRRAGMGACGKHFPGHGWVKADSHLSIPIDERPLAEIEKDMQPYRKLDLEAIMPAHVVYPEIDSRTAVFSPVWLRLLRETLGFEGVIFSDDLSMEGARSAGGILERVEAAWQAGCDMLLICNSPDSVGEVLDAWQPDLLHCTQSAKIGRLLPLSPLPPFYQDPCYRAGVEMADKLRKG